MTTQEAKQAGDVIYVIGETATEFGGSELQKLTNGGKVFGLAPAIDLEVENAHQQSLLQAIKAGVVQSAHDVSEGGLAVAFAETVFGTEFGAEVELTGSATTALFSESQSRFVVTVAQENAAQFEEIVPAANKVGIVTPNANLVIKGTDGTTYVEGAVAEFHDAWRGAITCLLNSEA